MNWRRRVQGWLTRATPYAGVFTHSMGQTIVFSTLPALGREIGLAEVAIGAIISASSAVFFFGSRMWGRISDHWGRKPVILIGLWGYSAGTLLFATWFAVGMAGWMGGAVLYALIIATRMLQAMLMSGTVPSTAAWVADTTTPATRSAGMGRLGAASNIGSILGPAIGGSLAALGLLAPLVFAALATAVAAVLIHKLLRHEGELPADRTGTRKLRLLDRRYLPYLALGFIVFTGFSIVQQTLAFRIQDTLHLTTRATAQTFGYTMIASAVASLFAQAVLVNRLALSPMALLRSGIPLLLLAFAVLIWAASLPLFYVSMGLMGLGLGLCGPGFTSATSLTVSAREQGSIAGITTAIPALGFIVGPIAGTALYQVDPHYPYVLTTVMLIPAAIAAFRVQQYLHPE